MLLKVTLQRIRCNTFKTKTRCRLSVQLSTIKEVTNMSKLQVEEYTSASEVFQKINALSKDGLSVKIGTSDPVKIPLIADINLNIIQGLIPKEIPMNNDGDTEDNKRHEYYYHGCRNRLNILVGQGRCQDTDYFVTRYDVYGCVQGVDWSDE